MSQVCLHILGIQLLSFSAFYSQHFVLLVLGQVGYSKKIANVWTKAAEEANSSSNRSSEASSSGFSTPD
jgi:hypothetical protein